MKDIFQRKRFWAVLIILLLAVFVYPPFIGKNPHYGFVAERSWGWFFSTPKGNVFPWVKMEVDLKTLLIETIIAILLSIGICLIPFRKIGKLLKK